MNDKQSKSNLADDARKIAKALRFYAHATGGKTDALALAESLPGKIEALEAWGAEQSCNAEILRLKLESIESGNAEIGLRAQAQDAIDQQIMRAEVAESQLATMTMELDEARKSRDLFANRAVDERARAEAAESELAIVTAERDKWRPCAEEKIELLQREVDAHRKRIKESNFFEEMWRSAEKETIELKSQLAPHISEAYTQGVEDAANKAKQHAHGYGQYRDHAQAKSACETLATEILALLSKELATEDMRKKAEPTETQP